jgi:glutamyl-tRNA synthetase
MSEVVTRFAPSPTGLLHLGNVRTALLNWLYARRHGGRFLLRFEDTDLNRSEQQYIENISLDVKWLGLDWDGDIKFQSRHATAHQGALIHLSADGHAYRCFCSEHQLNLDRKLAASRGLPPRYAGRCRDISPEEAAQRADAGESHVWRLAVHNVSGEITVRDVLHGDIHFARRDLDDPVVVRSDGTFTFLLPNAVDDALDGITHVLRGDDHLTNSAYQVWLLSKLKDIAPVYRAPVYLHHGLLLSAEGSKLSKRSGSHSVAELRDEGLLPGALVQAMTRLGHPNMPEELRGTEQLAAHFEAEHVSTSSVRWSDEEMWRWHTRLLHALPADELAERLEQFVQECAPEQLKALAALLQGNLAHEREAAAFGRLLDVSAPLADEVVAVAAEAGRDFYAEARRCWQAQSDWKGWSSALKEATGYKGKALFMPLRAALTGVLHGPEMSHVVEFLGREGVDVRLQEMMERIKG